MLLRVEDLEKDIREKDWPYRRFLLKGGSKLLYSGPKYTFGYKKISKFPIMIQAQITRQFFENFASPIS